jgi:hypothetical protein
MVEADLLVFAYTLLALFLCLCLLTALLGWVDCSIMQQRTQITTTMQQEDVPCPPPPTLTSEHVPRHIYHLDGMKIVTRCSEGIGMLYKVQRAQILDLSGHCCPCVR